MMARKNVGKKAQVELRLSCRIRTPVAVLAAPGLERIATTYSGRTTRAGTSSYIISWAWVSRGARDTAGEAPALPDGKC